MKYILSLLLGLTLALTSIAQSHALEVGYGYSIKTSAIKTLIKLNNDAKVEGSSIFIAGYEYRLNDWLAVAAVYTQQSLSGSYNYSFEYKQAEVVDTLTFDYNRMSIVVEPKVYYPLNSRKFELYSSLRLGYKKENVDALSNYENITEILKLTDLILGNRLNLAITPIGMNIFPVKNVGFGLATNIGATYLFKASLIVRI